LCSFAILFDVLHEKLGLITLKEGAGDRKDPDNRVFYLWQDEKVRELLGTIGFKVCDFSKAVSKTGSGDVWMSYVLDKMKGMIG